MHGQEVRQFRAIVITGPVGSGKTTLLGNVQQLLVAAGISSATIDMDGLRAFEPKPETDPFGEAMGMRHLRLLAQSYREYGIRMILIANVIENDAGRQEHQQATPGYALSVVRLDVPLNLIDARLRERETGEGLRWHLNRAPELQGIMEANNVGDVVIDVGEHTPDQVAEAIVRRLELLPED